MEMTVCFTGHRTIAPEDARSLAEVTEREIRRLIGLGAVRFRAGGACGFDTVAALKVLELKKEFPEIRLELILPCHDQDKKWRVNERLIYARILEHADSVSYTSEKYTSRCMLARDRELVKGSDVCVAYLRRQSGGTAYTVRFAKSEGVEVINLVDIPDGLDK